MTGRVPCEVRQAQGSRVAHQRAQSAAPAGGLADTAREVVGDAHRQELGQPVPVADPGEGVVLGAGEVGRRFHDALHHLGQVEAAPDVGDGAEEAVHPVRHVEPKTPRCRSRVWRSGHSRSV